jgi:hypothetical protein
LAELLIALDKLVDEEGYWERFEHNANALFAEPELKDLVPAGTSYPGGRLPSKEVFAGVRDWVNGRLAEKMSLEVPATVASGTMKGYPIWPPPHK